MDGIGLDSASFTAEILSKHERHPLSESAAAPVQSPEITRH
jgi:hypothetical protein